ncbi:uncharacterized protein Z518_06212 [Rhinocladiella mackenziei CBS 650.93]|uniref:Defect at low temperature protein 1 n=1 Tax=Rhinocladiella mackenziei CBS 650.93 TaxID=1442369 RepID=A0A0D2J8C2_9EURO|nr:uncharacterized protein Z518_06212 [Rhinocladiella mackenziei CBS 650.93]KIX05340.1 hypothetical protein Z518_06212 [Rhinocladiella mackenziei CBS 650.93]
MVEWARARQILFRIFYSTSFTAVFLIQISFICVTPADALYESYKRRRLLDIFLITGTYVITALIAILIYASRIYTNRSILKEIPKTFMPIEQEDLPGRRIHKLIQECLERSAVIAYQSRPRSRMIEHDAVNAGARMLAFTKSQSSSDHSLESRWGKIAHPGWSSPASKDLPNLEYATVIDELADLVEAKAVSLAPVDPLAEPGPDGMPMPDPRVIDELTRPATMGMRPYLRHLVEIGVVPDTSLTAAFLTAYEHARFSSEPLTEEDFQTLMRLFAELLRNMTPVDVEMLDLEDSSYTSHSETSSTTDQHDHYSRRHVDMEISSADSTFSDSGSVRHHKPPPRRVSEDSAPSLSSFERGHGTEEDSEADVRTLRTALTTAPRSRATPTQGSTSRIFSAASRPGFRSGELQESIRSRPSSRSSMSSRSSRSNGSVIRLTRDGERSELPYRIHVRRIETP